MLMLGVEFLDCVITAVHAGAVRSVDLMLNRQLLHDLHFSCISVAQSQE